MFDSISRDPELGISNPEVGISNPEVGISNPEVGISNPEVGISNPSQQTKKKKKERRPSHQLTKEDLDSIEKEIERITNTQVLKIHIINSTNYKLQRTNYSETKWIREPQEFILPKETVLFGSLSNDNNFNGFATYSMIVNQEVRIRLEWKIFRDNRTQPSFLCESSNSKYSAIVESFFLQDLKFMISEQISNENSIYKLEHDYIYSLHMSTKFEKYVIPELFFKMKPEKTDIQDQFVVTNQIFSRCFPKLTPDFIEKLFLVFGNNSKQLSFEKFLLNLFTMSRGTIDEKAKLTFSICNIPNNEEPISKADVQFVSKLISEMLSNSSDSLQFVDELFLLAPSIQNKSLTLSEFVIGAKRRPEIFECFGLFPYIHDCILKPILDKLYEDTTLNSQSGILSESVERISSYTPYFESRHCILRQGFFAVYNSKDINSNPPNYLIALHAVLIKEEGMNQFSIQKSGVKRTFQTIHEKEKKMWVRALRANRLGEYRFNSFAPIRLNINTRWFIDGKEYFDALIPCLENAKTRIFIADWFLSEQLYLSRNPKSKRLDQLLKAAAERGVKIYILLWYASSLAFSINPVGTKEQLMKLNKNICVQLHTSEQLAWSHHQKFGKYKDLFEKKNQFINFDKIVVIDDQVAFVGGIDLCFGRYDDGRYLISDPTGTTYPGRDYVNLCREIETNGPADQDLIDRSTTPRMPWHDIMMQCDGLASKDVAFNFMQRWNFIKDKYSYAIEILLPLPVSHNRIDPAFYKSPYKECICQVLRSIGNWSCGASEKSIYNAYIETIQNAKHYIYIENQYFISSIRGAFSSSSNSGPKNKILYAIYERIKKAIDKGEKFRVIILLPVYPAGKLNEATTRYVIKKVYKTISRKENSILQKLSCDYPSLKIEDYISFYSLRNYGRVGKKILTEQVYIHSKMMLVDDQVAIIGSANINDRSMRGDRDSEIAVYLEQPEHCLVPSLMDGKPFKVSPFVQELRMNIWKRLLGIDDNSFDELLKDSVCDKTYHNLWRQRAIENSEIFKKVFPDIPENLSKLKVQGSNISTQDQKKPTFVGGILLEGISSVEKIILPSGEFASKNEEELKKIKGFLILFPDKFLQDEKISFVGKLESLLPDNLFT